MSGKQGRAATVMVLSGLLLIGVPTAMLGSSFAGEVHETYAAFQNNEINIKPPAPSVAEWPLIGAKVHAAWAAAATDLPALVQKLQPQLGNFTKFLLKLTADTAGGVLAFMGSLIIAGLMMAYGESGSLAMKRIMSRLTSPAQGASLHRLSTATIRSVATGVIGVAFIQALLLGVGFVVAGIPMAGVLAVLVLLLGIMQLPAVIISLPAIIYLWSVGDASTAMNVVFFASVANQQDAQVLLSAQVAQTYFSYHTTELRIKIARENAQIQQRSYEITERIYKSGEQSELDLQQAKTQYLATLATIPDLQRCLVQTRNALAGLLGRPPGELPELAGKVRDLPLAKPVLVRGVPANLLLRRPDVRSAAWQAAAQSAQIGIAEADFYPYITLLGTIAWSGNSLAVTPNTATAGIGPGITWNIFDHGRIANNVRLQDARLQQLLEQYQSTVLEAAREIDDAAIAVVKTAEQARVLRQSVQAARRSLELANARYREGYGDFQRVLDAQRALFSQEERELITRGGHIGAVVNLYRALGGGWLETPVVQTVPESTRRTMRERTDWGDLLDEPSAQSQSPDSSSPKSPVP